MPLNYLDIININIIIIINNFKEIIKHYYLIMHFINTINIIIIRLIFIYNLYFNSKIKNSFHYFIITIYHYFANYSKK